MKLKVKKIHKEAKIPSRGHKGDAGLDLFSCEKCQLKPSESRAVSTGIQVAIPDGCAGLIWDKSGVSLKSVHRLAGVVDSGYRGEVKVVLVNLGEKTFKIEKGMKIAQLLIQKVMELDPMEVDHLDPTLRGEGGFGSTGEY
ncbi:MAG: dUTP diphosphatase [Candidatus Aminicenantes bacterium]|nr:dUTP diphosphatase [Candidatus Aminicenantes bacterium]